MSPRRLSSLLSVIILITAGFAVASEYPPPPGGWDYLFDGDAAASAPGAALDGTWDHDNGTDQWDGTRPGTGNPGGIMVVPVAGEPGNNALLMVDAVTAAGSANNRRFALTHDLAAQEGVSESFVADGATLAFRLRLPSSAPDVINAPDGLTPHNGAKGVVNLAGPSGRVSFAFGIAGTDPEYSSDGMFVSDNNDHFLHVLNPAVWNEFWVTVERSAVDPQLFDLRVYLNGVNTPAIAKAIGLSIPVEKSYPYLSLQLSATSQTAAVELDFIAFKNGLHPPNDADRDGLPDPWELANFSGLSRSGDGDEESDGLTNAQEFNLGTDPLNSDSDGDALSDADEFTNYQTNPANADTDGDGLDDGIEINSEPATDPTNADTDSDGLSDSEERVTHGTDPTSADSDGDGVDDGVEIDAGYDPNDAGSKPILPTFDRVLINEFSADSGSSGRLDADGDRSDWIELWNPTDLTVNLTGYYLTDDRQLMNKWAFPVSLLLRNRYLVVFASAKNRAVAGSELHTNFRLSTGGEYLALTKDDGNGGHVVVAEYSASYPPQSEGISYGLDRDDLSAGYLAIPTPGAANGPTSIGFVADTQFDVDRGFFNSPFRLSITTATPGATIRYTTNGSEPTESSGTIYTGPITISGSTTIRAAAFKPGYFPTNVDTQTYLFLDDVRTQYSNGAAPTGWPSGSVNGQQFNYGMDPDITSRYSAQQMIDALSSIPSVSIAIKQSDLTGSGGIYVNPGAHGKAWERPASFEILDPSGYKANIQSNCGLRIRGGFSRSTGNPKHAFRLFFRGEYGDGKLKYPLFEAEGVDEFDKMDLRTAQNYSWSFQNDGRNTFLREVLARDLQGAIGQPYTKSRYYHLYLNGVYWGLYMTHERAEANFGATYWGGNDEDFDTLKSAGSSGGYNTEATDGSMAAGSAWHTLYNMARSQKSSPSLARFMQMQGLNPDGSRNPSLPVYLDVDNLIGYSMIMGYTGNTDGPPGNNNWFSVRNRVRGDMGFQSFVHDAEHSMGVQGDWSGNSDRINAGRGSGDRSNYSKSNPAFIRLDIEEGTPEFRLRFADRVHAALFNDGPLTRDRVLELLEKRREKVAGAIIAESARWGDSKRGDPYDEQDWINAANGLVSTINARREQFLGHLRQANLYPDLEAPAYVQHGGFMTAGGRISVIAPAAGTHVYYMIGTGDSDPDDWQDDLDPRLLGGNPDPAAGVLPISGAGGGPAITHYINNGDTWKYLDNGSNQGTAWRASSFNDNSWPSGATELGYGDRDEQTEINGGPAGARFATTYFRKAVTIPDPAIFGDFQIQITYDDSYAIFVNGIEVARHSGLSANAPYNEYATNSVSDNAADLLIIPTSRFRTGLNTIAVEIHQTSATSSDVSFNMRLTGRPPGGGDTIVIPIPEPIDSPVWIKSRTYNISSREWSALNEAFFTTAPAATAGEIVISEIHYHPGPPTAAELLIDPAFNQDDFEFVEVMNVGSESVDLGGAALVLIPSGDHLEGVDFTFPPGSLIAPGERLVVVANSLAFSARYPGVPIAGDYASRLANTGEWLTLADANGDVMHSFRYNDIAPWPVEADGDGPSLVLRDPESAPDPAAPANWLRSPSDGGSPGSSGGLPFTGDPLADADYDGGIALLEYLLGLSDSIPSSDQFPEISVVSDGGSDYIAISFRRDPRATDATHFIEVSDDLETWLRAEDFSLLTLVGISPDTDGIPVHTYRLKAPVNSGSKRYLRFGVQN